MPVLKDILIILMTSPLHFAWLGTQGLNSPMSSFHVLQFSLVQHLQTSALSDTLLALRIQRWIWFQEAKAHSVAGEICESNSA